MQELNMTEIDSVYGGINVGQTYRLVVKVINGVTTIEAISTLTQQVVDIVTSGFNSLTGTYTGGSDGYTLPNGESVPS